MEMIPAIALILCPVFVWYYYTTMYQNLMVSLTRQRLFSVRARLFDAALDGKLSFNDKAYGLTRQTINGLIHAAPELRLLLILMNMAVYNLYEKDPSQRRKKYQAETEEAMRLLNHQGREVIMEIRGELQEIVITHMIKSSIFLAPVCIVLKLLLKIIGGMDFLGKTLANCAKKRRSTLDWIYARAKAHC